MQIAVEMNLDHATLARTSYTILDVLSDVGGIQSIVMSAMGLVIAIWNYNHFENYMFVLQYYQLVRLSSAN